MFIENSSSSYFKLKEANKKIKINLQFFKRSPILSWKFLVILLWYKTHTAISRMLVNRSWMSMFNKYTHMAIVKNFKEKCLEN